MWWRRTTTRDNAPVHVLTLLAFAATELVLCLTPGPAVLLVVSQAMRRGARASVGGAVGILAGNSIYFALSAVGLGALLVASSRLFLIVKLVGAAYLVWTGATMILRRPRIGEAAAELTAVAAHHHVREGLVTQLANPKAIVFFTALLPQFVEPHRGSLALQLLILGIISIVIELPVLVLYGLLADRSRTFFARAVWVERVAGAFLVAAGVKLALVRAR